MTILTDSKLVVMQRLQQAAPHFTHHTSGEITTEKFEKMRAKFARTYGVDNSPSSKSRARKKGIAIATLIGWVHRPGRAYFWLLVSEGRGAVWAHEKLAKNNDERIHIFGGYELVHDGISWSWKYRESHIQSLRMSLHQSIAKKNDARVTQLITEIFATAGFRLARQQAGHLVSFFRSEWRRLRREPLPTIPTQMLYVRALPNNPSPIQQKRTPHGTQS